MVMRKSSLVIGLAALFLTNAGCSGDGLTLQGREDLKSGLAAYQAGDDRLAIIQADAVLRETSRGSGAMRAYYLRGLARYRLKEYSAAQRDLEYVVSCTGKGTSDIRIKALDTLGEVAYIRGDLALAERSLAEVVIKTPAGNRPADHANYRLGCIRQKQGRWREADLNLQRVTHHFGGTKLAGLASNRVLGRAWTIQAGSFEKKINARQQAEKFGKGRWKVSIEPVIRQGKRVFLLQIGRWNQYVSAAAQLSAVQKIKADAFLQVTR
ncbi:MAG: SPOR domain-containing protein [Phycisphaerae bacterium]|nr:SPOR domain-containing protein [Phycisphaerae bacterium]